LPTKIIFTITSTDPADVCWTVLAGVNSVTIEASGAGALGTPAIATSTSDVYQGGGGGSGQVGNITVPVVECMVLNIILGAVTPPGTTVAYGTQWRSMASQLSHVMEQAATLVGWIEVMVLLWMQMSFAHILWKWQ